MSRSGFEMHGDNIASAVQVTLVGVEQQKNLFWNTVGEHPDFPAETMGNGQTNIEITKATSLT